MSMFTSIKDSVVNTLTDYPEVGIATAGVGVTVPFIDTITDVAQCIAAVAGAIIALMTLYFNIKKYKQKRKEHKNHSHGKTN